jgi:hypothetical protein
MAIRQFHAAFLHNRRPCRRVITLACGASWIGRADRYPGAPVSLFHEVQRAFEFQLEFGAFGEIQFLPAA